nr:hypothetical protein [Beijerinckia indica]
MRVGLPSLGLEGEEDGSDAIGVSAEQEDRPVMPGTVLVEAVVDFRRVTLGHVGVVDTEFGRLAEHGVCLAVRGVKLAAHDDDVVVLVPGQSNKASSLWTRSFPTGALARQHAHFARIE